MSLKLLIANTGKKGARKFVLRQVSRGGKRGARAKHAVRARRRAKPRVNAWREKRTQPVLKAPKHRAAAYRGRGYSAKAAAAKARRNPGEYKAAFNRLKADMVAATKAAKSAAAKAQVAAKRTVKKASAARAAWRANPSKRASGKSVAHRLASLRARLRKNPVQSNVVGAITRKENPVAKHRKVGAHARKVKAYMHAHPKASLPAASKAVARHNPGKKKAKKSGRKVRKVSHKRASAPRKTVRRKRARRAASPLRHTVRRLSRGKRRLHKGARKAAYRKMNKGQRKAARHKSIVRHARIGGIRARLSGVSTETLRKYGLTRVNPSPMGVLKDVGSILPEMGVAALAFVGVAVGALKIAGYLPDSVKALWKGTTDAETAQRSAYVPVLGGVLMALGGYFGMRMYPKLAKFAGPVAFGGAAGAAFHALKAITVTNTGDDKVANPQISLGKSLGLPLGEYVSVAGYVDVGGGRMMSVNGIGEYVSVAGLGSRNVMRLPGGQSMRYEGSLSGMGEYVMDPVGLSGLSGGIFPSSTLVDNTQSQVPLNRAPTWGLKGDPQGNVNIRKLLGPGGDDGGVAGGIFDRSH